MMMVKVKISSSREQIKRFTEEVHHDVIALSGKKFFFLTRKLVLSVAGTIITYELVIKCSQLAAGLIIQAASWLHCGPPAS